MLQRQPGSRRRRRSSERRTRSLGCGVLWEAQSSGLSIFHRGLQYIRAQGFEEIEIESDSEEAIRLIKEGAVLSSSQKKWPAWPFKDAILFSSFFLFFYFV